MFGQWYEFEIIAPCGKSGKTIVIGYGNDASSAFVDAKAKAMLVAGQKDDTAHLPAGSYYVGRGREITRWR